MIIKRKLYNSIYHIEDERLFFNPAIRLKRVGQKYIERARKGIAEKLKKSAKEDRKVVESINKHLNDNNSSIIHNITERKLIKKAHDNGARTVGIYGKIDNTRGNNLVIFTKDLDKDEIKYITNHRLTKKSRKRYYKKILNEINKGREIIIQHPSGTGVDTYAHEVGHLLNYNSKNPITKLINKNQGRILPKRREVSKNVDKKLDARVVYKNPILCWKDGKLVELEESHASTKALKLMKQLDAPEEVIKKSKINYNSANKTYKLTNKAMLKESIANIIQIPSRKKQII